MRCSELGEFMSGILLITVLMAGGSHCYQPKMPTSGSPSGTSGKSDPYLPAQMKESGLNSLQDRASCFFFFYSREFSSLRKVLRCSTERWKKHRCPLHGIEKNLGQTVAVNLKGTQDLEGKSGHNPRNSGSPAVSHWPCHEAELSLLAGTGMLKNSLEQIQDNFQSIAWKA